jgi:hypothetical protein
MLISRNGSNLNRIVGGLVMNQVAFLEAKYADC